MTINCIMFVFYCGLNSFFSSNVLVNCKIDFADCFGKDVSGTPQAAQEGRLQGQGIVTDPVRFCCQLCILYLLPAL